MDILIVAVTVIVVAIPGILILDNSVLFTEQSFINLR